MTQKSTRLAVPIATWPRLIGVVLLTVLLAIGASGAAAAAWSSDPAQDPEGFVGAVFVGAAVGELIALGLLIWLLRRRTVTLRDLGWRQPTTATALALGVLLALAYAGLTAAAVPSVWEHAFAPTGLKLIAIAATVLVAGVVEEVVTRGYVMTALASMGHGRVVQVLASATAYGLAHPTALATIVFTFALGAGLAVVYLVGNRSLTPVIAAHMLVNLLIEPGLALGLTEYLP